MKAKQYHFKSHDIKILFGDLNFRVEKDYEEAFEIIDSELSKDEKIQELLKYDQLNSSRTSTKWVGSYKEMPITFLPTYKFEVGTNKYSRCGIKKRTPSWCDRVLWHEDVHEHKDNTPDITLLPLVYESKDVIHGDHKPVAAYFRISSCQASSSEIDRYEAEFSDRFYE